MIHKIDAKIIEMNARFCFLSDPMQLVISKTSFVHFYMAKNEKAIAAAPIALNAMPYLDAAPVNCDGLADVALAPLPAVLLGAAVARVVFTKPPVGVAVRGAGVPGMRAAPVVPVMVVKMT